MTLDTVVYIIIAVIGLIAAPFIYIWKGLIQRLEKVERKVEQSVTEEDVRRILNDKLEPLKSDLQEIKITLNSILNRLLDNK